MSFCLFMFVFLSLCLSVCLYASVSVCLSACVSNGQEVGWMVQFSRQQVLPRWCGRSWDEMPHRDWLSVKPSRSLIGCGWQASLRLAETRPIAKLPAGCQLQFFCNLRASFTVQHYYIFASSEFREIKIWNFYGRHFNSAFPLWCNLPS